MALTVSHGKKLDAERASCHKVENEQKSDSLRFLRRHCSSVLTICTVLEHSYPIISILKPNFIIPGCSFLLWSYFALFVNLSQLIMEKASQVVLLVKNPPGNAGDIREVGSILGRNLGSIPGGGNGHLLQYSRLGKSMDRGAWRATVCRIIKSWTRLKQHSTNDDREAYNISSGKGVSTVLHGAPVLSLGV